MSRKKRTVRLLRIIMPIIAIGITSFFLSRNGILPWFLPLPDTIQAQLDDAVDWGLDGIIIYTDMPGAEQTLYAAGLNNKASQEKADPRALFKIASISKLYIAVATAKLVTADSLSLDQTLDHYLPEISQHIASSEKITLEMLVQHRSGIPNFTDQEAHDWFSPLSTTDDQLSIVANLPADFEPGTRYAYSNTNYLLLGRILDNALGYDHNAYIKNEILLPLGLTETFGLLSQADSNKVMSGYWKSYDDDLKGLDFITPGGSMVATAEDTGIFIRALINGSLLNDQEQAIYSSLYEYDHTGWLPGYHSIARYHEDIDAVVIQFVSTTGETAATTATIVYNRIVRLLRKQL